MSEVVIRTAKATDFPRLLQTLIAAFGDQNPGHPFFDELMPETIRPEPAILDSWYVAARGEEILASTQVVAQRFRVAPGIELRVGGIGQVSCLPECRGQGLMSQLLKAAIARMGRDGYHVSILGGDRQRYRHYGWEVAGCVRTAWLTGRRASGARTGPPEGKRPTRWSGDEATEAMIYAAQQANPSGIIRTRQEMHLALKRLNVATWTHRRGGEFAFICLKGGAIADYGGDAGAMEELLGFLVARQSGLSVTMPAEEGSGALERLLLDFAGSYRVDPVDMIRIFSLKSLLEVYRPLLAQRLAGWSGSVTLEIAGEGEKVSISREGEGVRIGEATGPADLSLDRASWAPMLFGPFPLSLPEDGRVRGFVRQAFGLPVIWPLQSQI